MTLLSLPEMKRILKQEKIYPKGCSTEFHFGSSVGFRDQFHRILIVSSGISLGKKEFLSAFLELCGYDKTMFWDIPPLLQNNGGENLLEIRKMAERVSCGFCSVFIPRFKNIPWNIELAWFLGFFEGAGGKILHVPIEKNETNRLTFSRKGIKDYYPYLAWGRTYGKKYELFVLKEPGVYVDLNHWLVTESAYVSWTKKDEPGTSLLPMI